MELCEHHLSGLDGTTITLLPIRNEGNVVWSEHLLGLEMHVKELNDELIRTYHSRVFKTDLLDNAHTRLQHAQDELTAVQSNVHHHEAELHERDEQLGAS
jgi:hypothetical protein